MTKDKMVSIVPEITVFILTYEKNIRRKYHEEFYPV